MEKFCSSGGCFVNQIQHQSHQKHLCRRIPEGIVAGAALWGGGLKQVRHETLGIIVVFDVHKGVIAKAVFHVNEIQNTDFVAHGFKHTARISGQFSFGIQDDEGSVALQQIGFAVKPGFTGTGTAADQYIEISPVLASV